MVLHRVRLESTARKTRQSTGVYMMLLHMAVTRVQASPPTRHGYAIASSRLWPT